MYIPSAFRIEDSEKLIAFMREHSFATLITTDSNGPFASHLPLLWRPGENPNGTLVAHMARPNPQWQHFSEGREALAIFHGPHGYISPAWYEAEVAVPTWNYATVHVYGVPQIVADFTQVAAILDETVEIYESALGSPWSRQLPAEYREKLSQGIVAFEMPINRVEGKFKLGQNRPAADLRKVVASLECSGSVDDQALASLMKKECSTILDANG